MCMKYRAICFDFDYTLGDSTDSIVAGFQYGFTRLGWPVPDRETVRRTVGYLLEDAYTLLTGDRDPEHRAAFRPLFLEASMERQRRESMVLLAVLAVAAGFAYLCFASMQGTNGFHKVYPYVSVWS